MAGPAKKKWGKQLSPGKRMDGVWAAGAVRQLNYQGAHNLVNRDTA